MALIANKFKVEKILEDRLDLIPSPSVKIQIIDGKVCWHHPPMFCFTLQANFPAHNLNF